MKIPRIEEVDNWNRRPRRQVEVKDPPPEKYSIEWYLERAAETERSKASAASSRSSGSLASLAVVLALVGLVFTYF